VVGGKLYIGGEDGRLKCFNPDNGELHWQLALGVGKDAAPGSGGIESSPAVADGEVDVGHHDGYLLCADAQTGAEKWRARTGADAATGALIWRHEMGARTLSTACVVSGRIYLGSSNGWFHCFG
jgi:outer membrane protein assembly factor BamB